MSPNAKHLPFFPSVRLHTLKTHSGKQFVIENHTTSRCSIQLTCASSHPGPVNAVTFSSPPGTYLLTGSSDRDIHLTRALPTFSAGSQGVPPTTTTPIQKYEAHGYSVLDIAVAADNARFVSVGGDRQVFLWDVESGTTVRRWTGHASRVEAVDFGGEGDSVVVSGESPLATYLLGHATEKWR